MSFHTNFNEWESYSKKEGCPVCQKWPHPEGEVLLHDFPTSQLTTYKEACLRGECCLTLKPHAVEIFELNEKVLLDYMKEVQVCARVLKDVTKAIKINYEMHGNTIPHMHMHLFPRYKDDPFPGAPIDYRKTEPPVYKGNEFETFVELMKEKLK